MKAIKKPSRSQQAELNDWQPIDFLLQSLTANIPRQESFQTDQNVVAGYYFVKKLWNLEELNYMDCVAFISLLKLDSLKKTQLLKMLHVVHWCSTKDLAIEDFIMLQNYFLLTISNSLQMTSNVS